ncbi:hypothetical protein FOA52_003821 [Chlamydomonas sp. UWO 241]|nr:hypothetical protein FOA52_003821 [Chlamydomonas sp. UWO 241]
MARQRTQHRLTVLLAAVVAALPPGALCDTCAAPPFTVCVTAPLHLLSGFNSTADCTWLRTSLIAGGVAWPSDSDVCGPGVHSALLLVPGPTTPDPNFSVCAELRGDAMRH